MAGVLSTEARWNVCGEAKDGVEALLKAKQLIPDLILLDISMPGMNGLEVARRLRQDLQAAKILILSQNDAGPFDTLRDCGWRRRMRGQRPDGHRFVACHQEYRISACRALDYRLKSRIHKF